MRTLHSSTLLTGLAAGVAVAVAVFLAIPGLATADVSQPVVTTSTSTAAAGGGHEENARSRPPEMTEGARDA